MIERYMLSRKAIKRLVFLVCVGCAAFAVLWLLNDHHNWKLVQKISKLKSLPAVSGLKVVCGPSATNQLWAVARFSISPQDVKSFVEQNGLEAGDRTSIRHRTNLPKDYITLPRSEQYFYKSDNTHRNTSEILASSDGLVIVYVMLDD